jgi:type IX secretion system PorP/SprF family membrane protein
MKFLKRILVTLFLALVVTAEAQDIHFSQFYMSPLFLNPALTGVMNCSKRVSANYRNQWASVLRDKAFSTYSVGYDQRIPVARYDYFGIGGMVWGDRAGSLNFGTNQASLSMSFAKRMGGSRSKANYLSAGASLGVSNRRIDLTKAQFGTQYNTVTYVHDPSVPSNEPTTLSIDNFTFMDVNAGLLWFSVLGDNENFYIGGAYSHLNRANVSLYKNKLEPQFSKITLHAGGEFTMADRIALVPGALVYFQGPSTEFNVGTSLKFLLGNDRFFQEALQFGLWSRLGNKLDNGILMDALILSTRFDYNQFSIGFNFDLNTSSLRPATNSNGAFEFALQYKFCGKERRKVYCPNF